MANDSDKLRDGVIDVATSELLESWFSKYSNPHVDLFDQMYEVAYGSLDPGDIFLILMSPDLMQALVEAYGNRDFFGIEIELHDDATNTDGPAMVFSFIADDIPMKYPGKYAVIVATTFPPGRIAIDLCNEKYGGNLYQVIQDLFLLDSAPPTLLS